MFLKIFLATVSFYYVLNIFQLVNGMLIRHAKSRSRMMDQRDEYYEDYEFDQQSLTTIRSIIGNYSINLNEGILYKNSSVEELEEQTSEEFEASGINKQKSMTVIEEDIVTKFLRIVESQHELGSNCTAGTDLNLGEGVVDRYAQERFRTEANVAVNRANMLTRLWKYYDGSGNNVVINSEYLLHASVMSMVEFNENIFAAGNCYDKYQYKNYWLFCPYAYRLPEGPILVKDLAVEYKYLGNNSEWFYKARKNAERIIRQNTQLNYGYHTYTWNESAHTSREKDEILSVTYEDGRWSKPYYDCGGGNIWMLTYTVPFFGFKNGTYIFKGTSGIDIDLRKVDIDQCPLQPGSNILNIFAASDKCKKQTTYCESIKGLGFRRGSYKCVCRRGYYFSNKTNEHDFFDGTIIEEEFEKLTLGEESSYNVAGQFECSPCAEGCEFCVDSKPCVLTLNWLLRTIILGLSIFMILCLLIVDYFTRKYKNVKVVRAASPVLLRVIVIGAFFIYCTNIVMYPTASIYTCTVGIWFREIGFSLTYGALMLKTWRISLIFDVRSAKSVKITDMDLMKKLSMVVIVFSALLLIRTLVNPPYAKVVTTVDNLKTYLCETGWWDHSFSIMEALFLVWGIRLCIVVRKAPSEFNESRFISMAIYNEFLLSLFLKISMFFLHSPANPDLLYVICFCHTQITITLLLCFIFGSKAYVVYRGSDKSNNSNNNIRLPVKHISRAYLSTSQTFQSSSSINMSGINEQDIQDSIKQLNKQLELLNEKCFRSGNKNLSNKILALQESFRSLNKDDSFIQNDAVDPENSISSSSQDQESSIDKNRTIKNNVIKNNRLKSVKIVDELSNKNNNNSNNNNNFSKDENDENKSSVPCSNDN